MKIGYWKGKREANPKITEVADREIETKEIELKNYDN